MLQAAPVQWTVASGGNGHYYEYVSSTHYWSTQRAAAEARTHLGMSGYLVTLTSAAENDFVAQAFDAQSNNFAWIGASDGANEGVWEWVTGPESGTQFSQGANATAPFNFENWGSVEPNNSSNNEHWAAINLGPTTVHNTAHGEWGDAPSFGSTISGYIVE